MMNQHDREEQPQREDVDMMDSNGNIDIMMGKLEVGGVGGEDASPSPTEASTTDIVSSGMPKSFSSQQKRNKVILMSAIVISIIIVGAVLGIVVGSKNKRNKNATNGSTTTTSVSSNANFIDDVPTTNPTSTPTKAPISLPTAAATSEPTSEEGSTTWYATTAPVAAGAQFTNTDVPTTTPTVKPPTTAQFIDTKPTTIPTKYPTVAPIVTPSPTQAPVITSSPTVAPITTTTSVPTAKPVPAPTNPPTPSPVTTPNPTPKPITTSSPTKMPVTTPTGSSGGGSSIQAGTPATIISEDSIRIYQVTNTRNLLTSSNSRSMNSTGGVSYEFNSNTGFTSSVYFNGNNAITFDNPNTINTQIDNIYFYQDDPTWPTIEQSKFINDLTEVVSVGIIFVMETANKGQELLSALQKKRQDLINSNTFQISSQIYDTTGSVRGYKTTTRINTGIETTSSWQNGYAWFISNTQGFYSRDVNIDFNNYSPSDYKVFHYENDVNTVTFEWEYIDENDSNKSIKEGVIFEMTEQHATQLLQYMKTKFY